MKRLKDPSAHYRRLLATKSKTSQSVKDFCKAQGINVWTYYYWRRRLEQSREPSPDNSDLFTIAESAVALCEGGLVKEKAPPAFIPVTVKAAPDPVPCQQFDFEVELPLGGPILRLTRNFDRDSLSSLLTILQGDCTWSR